MYDLKSTLSFKVAIRTGIQVVANLSFLIFYKPLDCLALLFHKPK